MFGENYLNEIEEEQFEFEDRGTQPGYEIRDLPPAIMRYYERYPCTVRQIGSIWGEPDFPKGYVPEDIDIYYGDYSSRGASICIADGRITHVNLEANWQSPVVKALVEDELVYVEIAGRVLLDRLNGMKLPAVVTNPAELLQIVTRFIREAGEEQS